MPIPGNLLTTAMAVMPHRDVDRALETALSMDIPFWPQLPHYSYYEDMYVQASENFPGILLDMEKRTLRFSHEKFITELEEAMTHFEEPDYFDISDTYSVVYGRFLSMDLSDRPAIRGQLEGPISFGFNVVDQDDRPILFDDTIRPFMLDFMARRVNVQLGRLKKINPNAFMFVDEPGLQFLFSAMAGYGDQAARADMEIFFSLIQRPRGVHLCGNPDWTCSPLTSIQTGRSSRPTAPPSGAFWTGEGSWYGGWCPPTSSPLKGKIWSPLKAGLKRYGRPWKKRGSTGISSCPAASYRPPPAALSTRTARHLLPCQPGRRKDRGKGLQDNLQAVRPAS